MSLFESLMESATVQDIFFSFDLSHTRLFSWVVSYSVALISPLYSLDFCSSQFSHSRLSDSELSHQLDSYLHFSSKSWTNISFSLSILGSYLTIFLFFFTLSHIMFLPNPNPAEQLVVFPSQSQIFRLLPTILLFFFALSHIIFFFHTLILPNK